MAEVQATLDAARAQFDAAMAQKAALEEGAAACQRRMDSATALLQALAGACFFCCVCVCVCWCFVCLRALTRCVAQCQHPGPSPNIHTHANIIIIARPKSIQNKGEEARWTAQSRAFDDQIQRLAGDCVLASAFVSYLGELGWIGSPLFCPSLRAPSLPLSFLCVLVRSLERLLLRVRAPPSRPAAEKKNPTTFETLDVNNKNKGPFNREFRDLLLGRDFYGGCERLGVPVTQNCEVRWLVVVGR